MPTITKSIGTSSRDYSTVVLWEADLDDGGIYSASDDAVGEMYNDSDFGIFDIDGGGTIGLNSITLKPASGEGHSGVVGAGVTVVASTNNVACNISQNLGTTNSIIIEDIEFDGDSRIQQHLISVAGTANGGVIVRRCIVHNITGWGGGIKIHSWSFTNPCYAENNLVFNNTRDYSANTNYAGIHLTSRAANAINNTVYNQNGTANNGVIQKSSTTVDVKNNLSIDCTGACFDLNATGANNASSDATGDVTGLSEEDVFVDSGSNDFSLLEDADVVDAGTDLGTVGNVDITGRDRDAEDDVWDIGAYEYFSASTPVSQDLIINSSFLSELSFSNVANYNRLLDITKDSTLALEVLRLLEQNNIIPIAWGGVPDIADPQDYWIVDSRGKTWDLSIRDKVWALSTRDKIINLQAR